MGFIKEVKTYRKVVIEVDPEIPAVCVIASYPLNLSVDLLMRLEDRYDSEPMLKARGKAARALLTQKNLDDVDEVLDFFEGLGILLRKGALDLEMVWSSFSYCAVVYWLASEEYIAEVRGKDSHYWGNFERLIKRINRMSKRRYRKSPYLPPADEIRRYLADESKLVKGRAKQ